MRDFFFNGTLQKLFMFLSLLPLIGCSGDLLRYRTKMWKKCQENVLEQKKRQEKLKENCAQNAEKAKRRREILVKEVKKLKDDLQGRESRIIALEKKVRADAEQIEELDRQKKEAQKRSDLFKKLAQKLREMIEAGSLKVEIRKGRMIVKMSDRVLFDPGRAKLKKEAREPLKKLAEVLKDIPDRDFVVAGHTDDKKLKSGGRFKSNWELSAARSVQVVKFLQREGVDGRRLSAAGYSEFDPVADNSKEGGRTLNRRIEIVVMPKISELPRIELPKEETGEQDKDASERDKSGTEDESVTDTSGTESKDSDKTKEKEGVTEGKESGKTKDKESGKTKDKESGKTKDKTGEAKDKGATGRESKDSGKGETGTN